MYLTHTHQTSHIHLYLLASGVTYRGMQKICHLTISTSYGRPKVGYISEAAF